jgi:hypothetical protein
MLVMFHHREGPASKTLLSGSVRPREEARMPGIAQLAKSLRDAAAAFEPGLHSGEQCAALVEEVAATRRACEALEARAAARVASLGTHRAAGFADAGDWLASRNGSTTRAARDALATIVAAEHCPHTNDALLAGAVSLAQAAEIVRTEREVPGTEAELLKLAQGASLGAVRDRARTRRVESVSAEVLYAKQRSVRSFAHWRDELGMVCVRGRLMPHEGIALVKRVDAEADRAWRRAHGDDRSAPREARAADAFVRVTARRAAGKGGAARATSADVVLVCDVRAYQRGHAHLGEPSHVVGGGPIPVAVVRELSKDAFLKVAFHDGVQVHTVAHFGRRIPAAVRTALELGAPPEFAGATCSEAGCDRRYGLEWDHVDPVAHGGLTNAGNLKPECKPHHRAKTERDRAAGLLTRAPDDRGPP